MVSLFEELKGRWSTTMWFDIDTDYLQEELVRLQNQIKRMPREVKGWPVYKQRLEERHEHGNSDPISRTLKTDAMQDRHWSQS